MQLLKVIALTGLMASEVFVGPAVADPLDDAAAVCAPHKYSTLSADFGTVHHPKAVVPYEAGWEHCGKILDAKKARDDAAALLDEANNPDLKMTRDFAKTLGN